MIGKANVLHGLTSKSLVGRTDPNVMFDEFRSLHMCYNRTSPNGISTNGSLSCAIDAMKRNPLYRNFVEIQHGLGTMKFDDFDANTLRYNYEHVPNMFDESSHILVAMHITDVVDVLFYGLMHDYIYMYVCMFRDPMANMTNMANIVRERG